MKLKKAVRKAICFMLVITMLIVPTVVFATNESTPIQPRWSHIFTIEHFTEKHATRNALVFYAAIETYSGYTGIEAQMQKYNFATEEWEDVEGKFWDIADEDEYCYIDETCIPVSSGVYRFEVTYVAYATNWIELEHFMCYTDQVTV